MRRFVADILHAFGIGKVHEAANGEEALGIMNAEAIEIVLCDSAGAVRGEIDGDFIKGWHREPAFTHAELHCCNTITLWLADG